MSQFRWMSLGALWTAAVWSACGECPAQTRLALKFRDGETVQQEMLESVQVDVIPPGEKRVYTTVINQRLFLDSTTAKLVDDSAAEIRQKFSRISLSVQLPPPVGKMFTVDTNRPAASEEKVEQDMRFGISKVIGFEWMITLQANGDVRDVGLTDELTDVLVENPQTGPLKETFSEGGLRKIVEQSTVTFPDHPLNQGEKWEQTVIRPFPEGKLTNVRTCTLVSAAENGLVKIAVKSQLSYESTKNAKRPLTLTEGSGEGEVYFNVKAGRVVRSKFTQVLVLKDATDRPGMQRVKTVNTLLPIERETSEQSETSEK